jgi:hypothetical protein
MSRKNLSGIFGQQARATTLNSAKSLFNGKALQSAVTGGKSLMQSGVNAGRSLFGKLGGGFGQPAYAGGNPAAFGGSKYQHKVYTPKSATPEAPVGSTPTTSGKSAPQSTGRSVPQDHDIAPPTSTKKETGGQVAGNNNAKAPKDTDPAPSTTADKTPPKDKSLADSRRRAQSNSQDKDLETPKSQQQADKNNRQQNNKQVEDNLLEYSGGDKQQYVPDLSHIKGKTASARNRAIDAILKEDLSGLSLTHKPRYSPFARTGIAKQNSGTHVGKNVFSSRSELIDTIVHEELHHRWWKRGIVDHHPESIKLGRSLTNDETRKGVEFYATIARYKRMKGLPYRQEHIDRYYQLINTQQQ